MRATQGHRVFYRMAIDPDGLISEGGREALQWINEVRAARS